VGWLTLVVAIHGLPAIGRSVLATSISAAGNVCESGAVPGQIRICACPVDGCQTTVFACALPQAARKNNAMVHSFKSPLQSGARPMSVIEKKTGRPRFGGLHAMSDLRQSNWSNPAIDNSSRARARPGLSISWILSVGLEHLPGAQPA
jgi:hypothetical protein